MLVCSRTGRCFTAVFAKKDLLIHGLAYTCLPIADLKAELDRAALNIQATISEARTCAFLFPEHYNLRSWSYQDDCLSLCIADNNLYPVLI